VISGELLRYAAAGVANTVVGYAVFLVLLHVAGAPPLVANVGCYVIGLMIAYALNLSFVFRGASHSWRAVARFLAGAGAAWLINAAVLTTGVRGFGFPAEIVQVFAMAAYTGSFYLINRHFVWARD
jgi:putative flippase GtrA